MRSARGFCYTFLLPITAPCVRTNEPQGSAMKTRRLATMLFAILLSAVCAGLIISAAVPARAGGDSNWGFSLTNLDRTRKPCEDFYEFAMGGWMKANPIPAEYSTWGTFAELRDKNLTAMRTILENAGDSHPAAGSNDQKIGDLSCRSQADGLRSRCHRCPSGPQRTRSRDRTPAPRDEQRRFLLRRHSRFQKQFSDDRPCASRRPWLARPRLLPA